MIFVNGCVQFSYVSFQRVSWRSLFEGHLNKVDVLIRCLLMNFYHLFVFYMSADLCYYSINYWEHAILYKTICFVRRVQHAYG